MIAARNLAGLFDPRFDPRIERAVAEVRRYRDESAQRALAEAVVAYLAEQGVRARAAQRDSEDGRHSAIRILGGDGRHWLGRMAAVDGLAVWIDARVDERGAAISRSGRRIELTLSSLGSPIASLDARHELGHARGSPLAAVQARFARSLREPVLENYRDSHAMDEATQFYRDVRLGARVMRWLSDQILLEPPGALRELAVQTAREINQHNLKYERHAAALAEADLRLARAAVAAMNQAGGAPPRAVRVDSALAPIGGDSILFTDFYETFGDLAESLSPDELRERLGRRLATSIEPELARLNRAIERASAASRAAAASVPELSAEAASQR